MGTSAAAEGGRAKVKMMILSPMRLHRERATIAAMLDLYCRKVHRAGDPLCPECHDLLEHATRRLARCPFQAGKSTCARCAVHCYTAVYRERMKHVMRVAGPAMIWRHPWLTMRHVLDGFRPVPRPELIGSRRGLAAKD
jgi:hypothetical protein